MSERCAVKTSQVLCKTFMEEQFLQNKTFQMLLNLNDINVRVRQKKQTR